MTQSKDTSGMANEFREHQDLQGMNVNLRLWTMLHAVVNCGSFSGAAEFLQVSQPTVSYAIAKLEEQVGVPLLKLVGRKAHLTAQGRVLVERSKGLLHEAIELEKFAENLKQNWRPEVGLAVNGDFPACILIPAIRAFSQHQQSAKVNLIEGTMPQIERALRDQTVDLAINRQVPHGLHGELLLETEYVAVAHPEHPLATASRELTQADLAGEVQVCSNAETDDAFPKPASGREGNRLWLVSSYETAERAVVEGLGYGWLPMHRVRNLVDGGMLKVLPVEQGLACKMTFFLIHRPSILTSEASRLADVLRKAARG